MNEQACVIDAPEAPCTPERVRRVGISELDLRYSKLRVGNPQIEARLQRSVEREGLHQPVLVSAGVESGRLVVIDGLKRVRVAQALGLSDVLVRVVHLDSASSEGAIVSSNASHAGLNVFEQGLVVQSLHREHGLSQVEIADLLKHHKTWVCRRLKLVEHLASEVIRDLQLGLIAPTVARALSALPRGNQARVAQAIAEHGLSSRQAEQLVKVIPRCDAETLKAVLAHPHEHLHSGSAHAAAVPDDPNLSVWANQLRARLLQLGSASHRVLDALRGLAGTTASVVQGTVLKHLCKNVRSSVERTVDAMTDLISDDGSEDEE